MEFRDFNIEILAKRDDGFDIRVVSKASGELPATIQLKHTVEELLQMFESSNRDVRSAGGVRDMEGDVEADEGPTTEVGQELFELLFSAPEVNRALAECMTDAKANDAGVRLKLTMNTKDDAVADLARLPWELLHDSSKYKYFGLRPDSPIVRYLEVPKPFAVEPFQPPLRILVVSANPRNDLALDKERDNLVKALGSDPNIALDFVEVATIQKIASKLAEANAEGRNYHVLHYMGHGDYHQGKGVLLLHKEDGGVDFVDSETFNTALQASGSIRMVFLNACNTAQSGGQQAGQDPFSGVATALVFEGVPAVVAMQRPIPDKAAIVLAQNFYPNIAKGWPVDAAVSEGRRQVFFDNRGTMDWAIPVLFMRAPNGVLFDFPPEPVVAAVESELPPVSVHVEPIPLETSEKATRSAAQGSSAPGAPAWKKWAPIGGIGVLGVLAGVFLIPMLGGPDEPADVDLELASTLDMGQTIIAEFELEDEAGTRITGKTLQDYEVEWSTSDSTMLSVAALPVEETSQALTAEVTGLRAPASKGDRVTVTASLAGFDAIAPESKQLSVALSQEAKDQFREAFRAARAQFENAEIDNTTVAAAYQEILDEWGWILGYVDEIPAFTEAEKADIAALAPTAKSLREAASAFETLEATAGGSEGGILFEKAWTDYVDTWGSLRASPSLQTAQASLAAITEAKRSSAWVKDLLTCSPSGFSSSKCTARQGEFNDGDQVRFSVVWRTPPTMSGRGGLMFEIVTLEDDGSVTAVGTPPTTSQESGRTADRNWWGSFTIRSAKTHQIRVKNEKGQLVWREELTVR